MTSERTGKCLYATDTIVACILYHVCFVVAHAPRKGRLSDLEISTD